MIQWLIQSVADHPELHRGRPPQGLLTSDELTYFNGYHSQRRRRDWLLGRWTAKQLVQIAVARKADFRPKLDSFTIAQDACGAPYIASDHCALSPPCTKGRVPLSLSISHSYGHSLCAVAHPDGGPAPLETCPPPPPPLGADIELVERRRSSFHADFFTGEEQRHLGMIKPELQPLLTTATWSAKEAALKSIQVGLRADPHIVQCFLYPAYPRGWTPFLVEFQSRVEEQVTANSNPHGNQSFSGWWRVAPNRLRSDSFLVATLVAQGITL